MHPRSSAVRSTPPRRHPTDTVVVATGEIDLHTAPLLHDAIEQAAATPTRVVVDLTAVTFIDSSGLAVLAAAHQRRTDAFAVRGPSPSAAKVLACTGLDNVLTVERQPIPTAPR